MHSFWWFLRVEIQLALAAALAKKNWRRFDFSTLSSASISRLHRRIISGENSEPR